MEYWFAATIAYAVVITCLFVIVYSSADENSMLYNKRIEKLLKEINFQNEVIDNLRESDDALYDETGRRILSLEDENMILRLALIEMKGM